MHDCTKAYVFAYVCLLLQGDIDIFFQVISFLISVENPLQISFCFHWGKQLLFLSNVDKLWDPRGQNHNIPKDSVMYRLFVTKINYEFYHTKSPANIFFKTCCLSFLL